MISVTFNAKTANSRRIQNLVKQYGGWFDANPMAISRDTKKSQFRISFNNAAQYKQFSVRSHLLEQPFI